MKRSFSTLNAPTASSGEKQNERADDDGNNKLSQSQKEALELVMRGTNVFITGKAGSGKSHLIRCLKQRMREAGRKMIVTASTGIAAFDIGGSTLHSRGGFGIGDKKFEQLLRSAQRNKSKAQAWCQADALLIDECSMVTTAYMNKLDRVLRRLRKRANEAMGGIQVIFIGDFLQNPAITKPDDVATFDDAEARAPLFESSLWKKGLRVQCVLLRENFRQQSDEAFAALLDRARLAQLTEEDVDVLRSRLIERHSRVDQNELVKPRSYRKEVEAVNRAALQRLSAVGEQHYSAVMMCCNEAGVMVKESEEARQKDQYAVDVELTLRVGARVMLRYNLDVARGLFNGVRGTVLGFKRSLLYPQESQLYPEVEFEGRGGTVILEPHKWEVKEMGRLLSSFEQIPLSLCYAMTIHKAQGATLPPVLLTMNCFGAGQAYVALSRVRRLEDLYLTNVDAKCVKTDAAAVKFYTENNLL